MTTSFLAPHPLSSPDSAAEIVPSSGDGDILARALCAIARARAFSARIRRPDGHWCVELESNTTITAEYVFMRQALGLELESKRDAMIRYFFGQQKADGSWGLATNHVGDVSTTAETYLALRILGVPTSDARMQDAERFILTHGGLEKMRVFTRIFFAMFGLFPWSAVPTLPPEFILLPPSSPANVYALSSWARGTMVPLLILLHHKPLFALPNGKSKTNDYLDHLWLDPTNKNLPYSEPLTKVLRETGVSWSSFFTAADRIVRGFESAQNRFVLGKLRAHALKKCEQWILERQEPNGDWAGIFPPMLNVVLALFASGYSLKDGPVARGLEALDRFSVEDEAGFRIEPCQSPVWDTILMMIGLLDTDERDPSLDADPPKAGRAIVDEAREWIARRQIFAEYGDWRVYNPDGPPGGWSFEYTNTWYPDVDDTAAIVIGFLKHDPSSRSSESIRRAARWIVSMQNDDGGWAAFDRKNDKEFLNKIPFSDMDALCDPSTPDIVGRVLEALGILGDPEYRAVCDRAIDYLRKSQEPEGSWFGRWGVNYVYGTSNVLCALAHQPVSPSDPMITRALAWLRRVQNADGGWGECLESYENRALMGKGRSTASQTAWALMGLLAFLPREGTFLPREGTFLPHEGTFLPREGTFLPREGTFLPREGTFLPHEDPAVLRGIQWLLDHQNEAGSWDETEFTGTGFPKHFYLRYNLYRHYFPLMALGRFVRGSTEGVART